ncbi:hypothetical protein D0Z08_19490 [Nocardioides immobilis]|uniref:Uncharacterized protein n=1 Tax=Nocardioides immobilis TaxID=2049295 RepID=A0A417XYH3_9ACTN|nr:hypothetical protein D0Z08_19490 [Nocardioides immobilis]
MVRDAADADALAHLNAADPALEASLRAALLATNRQAGLVGLVQIHQQRRSQTADPEWKAAHAAAIAHYERERANASTAARALMLAARTTRDGGALAPALVLLAEHIGGPGGVAHWVLLDALRIFRALDLNDGGWVVVRRLLAFHERQHDTRWDLYRRGILTHREAIGEIWSLIADLWHVAPGDLEKQSVRVTVGRRVEAAVERCDFEELYDAWLWHAHVAHEPPSPYLEAEFALAQMRVVERLILP